MKAFAVKAQQQPVIYGQLWDKTTFKKMLGTTPKFNTISEVKKWVRQYWGEKAFKHIVYYKTVEIW